MSSIGGPGGIGGPKGPSGPGGPGGPGGPVDVDGPDAADGGAQSSGAAGNVRDVRDVRGPAEAGHVDAAAGAKASSGIEAMAADIAAGKLTANEAIERLVNEIAGADHLGPTEQAELKEMLTDLVANDPYLQSLVGRI